MAAPEAAGADWTAYGGAPYETHFSSLDQINDKNIRQLGLAWSYDLPTMISSVGAPLEVDGVLYVGVGYSVIYAFEATTGKKLWEYDPQVTAVAGPKLREAWGIRGISYWDGKIYAGTQDGRLIAIDSKTGKPVWSVQTTLPHDARYITGAPHVFNGKVIIGHGGADFGPTRGYVTTYDARSGKFLWRFYTVPGNPAHGFENKAMAMAARTWTGKWWTQGGGGTVWDAITYDPDLNLIYLGVGNGAPWNQKFRSPGGGDNLFLCSIVALNADTGEYVWHYQVNPGETWDWTASQDIELATLNIGGQPRRVILHAPKNGFFYVIDRDTGKLISAEPYTKVNWATKIDLASGRPVETAIARPANGSTILWPGTSGAHSWQPMSFSPQTGLVYIPTLHLPGLYDFGSVTPDKGKYHTGSPIVFDRSIKILDNGPPPVPTGPMGSIQAWNPITQTQVWSADLQGPMNGGIASTAGNLVFQGYADGRFTARSAGSGEILWSFDAQNGILGQPITFTVHDKQYVSVVTGFGGTAGVVGLYASQFGWDYRTQMRRVLTFTLGGSLKFPPAPPRTPVVPYQDPAFKVDPAKSAKGFEIYSGHCMSCHGMGAVAGGSAPDLRASSIPTDKNAFNAVVRDGGLESLGMPKFGELTADDAENLMHYIREQARPSNTPPH